MDQWLVRTANNILAGPYTREHVIQLVQEGKIGLHDEICEGKGYWIYLHEHQEVQRQLGIQVPRPAPESDDEVTETQIEVAVEEATDSGVDDLSELANVPDGYEGGTAVIPRPTPKPKPEPRLREGTSYVPAPQAVVLRTPTQPPVQRAADFPPRGIGPQVERPSMWRGLAWILVIIICLIVATVLRLLRAQHGAG